MILIKMFFARHRSINWNWDLLVGALFTVFRMEDTIFHKVPSRALVPNN